MKKLSCSNDCNPIHSVTSGNPQLVNTEQLNKTNKEMAERIAATQLLIIALQKKMTIQDNLWSMSADNAGSWLLT